jgi:hypothetical protein
MAKHPHTEAGAAAPVETYSGVQERSLVSLAVNEAPQRKWASEADWNRLKDTVIRLYWTEDKTLNEVMKTMERDHGFYATYAIQ